MNKNIPHITYKDEYDIYLEKIEDVGNDILRITSQFEHKTFSNIEELKVEHDIHIKALYEYKDMKLTFMLAVVPVKLNKLHDEMADGLQMFITGAQYMVDATDITNVTEFPIDKGTIEEDMEKGILVQKQGEVKCLKILDEIVKIISRIRR